MLLRGNPAKLEKIMADYTDTAESQARAQVASIVEMVAALDVDYDRLEELREERKDWFSENPGSFIEPNDPRTAGRWCMACPDEAEELAELEEAAGECTSEDDARERIQEDPLSVGVRSDWESSASEFTASEFRIVLCTGGPHVEIVGELDNGSPSRVRVLYKDWGTHGELFDFDHDAVLRYCEQFYFGE